MKFKSVDIVGFRAYAEDGDGSFDFKNSDGQVSNFISIYAPNGFGKSSFYDAVEWAITNNIGRYIRDSQRTNNDSASLYLNTSESSQRILKNRYIDENAASYVKVCTTGKKDFKRTVRRPAAGQRDYTYDTARTDKTTKHLADIFLSQDAIDAFLKEERPEQRYDRFMGAFGGNDEKYRSSLFTSIKSCSRELKQLSETISSLEENLREPTLQFSVDEVNQTIDEINIYGGNFPKIGNTFSELEQTELLSMLSKRIIEINTQLESLDQQKQAIDYCVGNLPQLMQYREHRDKLKADLAKINSNWDEINSLAKSIDTKKILEQRLRNITDEISTISLILSNQQQLNNAVENITNYKNDISSIDKEFGSISISNSANTQTLESLKNERITNDTKMASLLDDLSKVEAQFLEIDELDKLIHILKSKVTESERRTITAHALKKSLQVELSKYANIAVGKSIISEDAQALLKPDPEFVMSYHQNLKQRNDIQEQIHKLDVNAKDLSGQSADLFSLIKMAKTLLSRTRSDSCPVCNTQYESHTALLEKIQSNGSIEAALQSLLMSRADLEKRIVQIDEFLDRGHIYLTSLKAAAIANINERISNVEFDIVRLDQELADVKHEQAVKTDNLHRLKAGARNLTKDDYVKFINNSISSVKADIVKVDNSIEDLKMSIKSANDLAVEMASNRAFIVAKLEVIEQSDIYTLYKTFKGKYILPEGGVQDLFSPIYGDLTETKVNLHKEIASISEAITKLEISLAQPGMYLSEPLLIDKRVSLTEELHKIEDAIARIEVFIIPLVNDFNASTESLLNGLQLKKADLDKKTSNASSSLMLTNIVQAQISDVLPFFKFREMRAKIELHRDAKNQIENLCISLDRELKKVEAKLKERIDNFFYTDLITSIYRKIDPHPFFKIVKFECVFPVEDKPRLEVYLYEDELSQPISPALYFSSAQLNILSLSIFLAKALHIEHEGAPVRAILIDDPINSMDSINVLSVIDLLRNISINFDRQIILSTHDENFYELIKLKVPEEKFGSKFIRFKSFGVVQPDSKND